MLTPDRAGAVGCGRAAGATSSPQPNHKCRTAASDCSAGSQTDAWQIQSGGAGLRRCGVQKLHALQSGAPSNAAS